MHVVQLLAPRLEKEDHMKEMDFSPDGIRARWQAGYENTGRALARAAWIGEFSTIEGVILHQLDAPDPAKLADAAE
jgi:NTE family protein